MPPFSGEPDIISRASSVATTMTAVSEGSMRSGRAKANEFILKNGRRHHAYEVDKVPYPLAYETEYLDL